MVSEERPEIVIFPARHFYHGKINVVAVCVQDTLGTARMIFFRLGRLEEGPFSELADYWFEVAVPEGVFAPTGLTQFVLRVMPTQNLADTQVGLRAGYQDDLSFTYTHGPVFWAERSNGPKGGGR